MCRDCDSDANPVGGAHLDPNPDTHTEYHSCPHVHAYAYQAAHENTDAI